MSESAPMPPPAALRRDITPRPASIALAAGISVLLHLAAMAALAPQEQPRLEGGGEAAPAALGTSFADFAQGMLVPEQPETVTPHSSASPPVHTPPPATQPAAAPMLRPTQDPVAVRPVPADTAHEAPETTSAAPALPPVTQHAVAPRLAPAQDPAAVMPAPAEATAPGHSADSAEATPVQEVALAAPSEVVTPDTTPTELAPAQSRRPAPRPEPPAPRPQQAQPQPQRPPQGNAPQAAQRGSPEEAQGDAASAAPARPQAEAAGNAAASNYPGEVLRRIQRVRQTRSPARGRVLVSFSISDSGGLSAVSVARSSGNAALDRVALDHIRRAAPFPPPPSGAQRQFSFEFVGR